VDHPNLDPRICALIEKSEKDGGIYLTDLFPGDEVRVQTRNTLYTIRKVATGNLTIQGHAYYCPKPVVARINGSTWGGSMLKMGFIGKGMHLEFTIPGSQWPGAIITTQIQSVELAQPNVAH